MNVLLEGKSLSKAYKLGRQTVEVLQDVDLIIKPSDRVVIAGPSGAGKSTLLHLLGGMDPPTQGTVLFGGENLYRIPERRRAQIRNRAFGFVFQFYHLVPELTALENIILPARIARRKPRSKAESSVPEARRLVLPAPPLIHHGTS